jgi:hypothetical protein
VLGFASDVQTSLRQRDQEPEHLIAHENIASSAQEFEVTRILPSGWRSMTIVVLSDVAKRSRTFSAMSTPETPLLRGGCARGRATRNLFLAVTALHTPPTS